MLLHRTAALLLAAGVLGWAGCAVDDTIELNARRLPVAAGQPNIVVIMTDDLDTDLLQTMLDLDLAPNIERYLVAEGTTFTSSFVSNSLCCPSRATMLTGQYSHNNGVFGVGPLLEHSGVDALDDVSTLATWLPEAPSFIRRRSLTETDIANLTRFYRERLAAMLAVDDMVGQIVQTLFDRGILDQTIIVFTSDNGWVWGQHHLVGKQVVYEESIRVPLFIRMPAPDGGTVTATVSQMVVNADLAPTIAQLAGASPGLWVDGRSLVPLLSVDPPATPWRHQLLVEHWIEGGHVPSYAALRTGRYVYVDYFESSPPMRELYDLDLDPFQRWNVYASPDYAGVVGELEPKLADMRGCALGSCQQLEEE